MSDYAPIHAEARRIGREDGASGVAFNAAVWPSGIYGHADYWLGYVEAAQEATGKQAVEIITWLPKEPDDLFDWADISAKSP